MADHHVAPRGERLHRRSAGAAQSDACCHRHARRYDRRLICGALGKDALGLLDAFIEYRIQGRYDQVQLDIIAGSCAPERKIPRPHSVLCSRRVALYLSVQSMKWLDLSYASGIGM